MFAELTVITNGVIFTVDTNSATFQLTSQVIAPVGFIHMLVIIAGGCMFETVASFWYKKMKNEIYYRLNKFPTQARDQSVTVHDQTFRHSRTDDDIIH